VAWGYRGSNTDTPTPVVGGVSERVDVRHVFGVLCQNVLMSAMCLVCWTDHTRRDDDDSVGVVLTECLCVRHSVTECMLLR
jgi:hypothetical protein